MDCLPHRAAAVTNAIIALLRGAARQPAPGRRLATLELAARRPCRAPRTATFAASRKKWVRDAMAGCGDRIAFTLTAHSSRNYLRSSRSCRGGVVRLLAPRQSSSPNRMRRDSAKIRNRRQILLRTQHHRAARGTQRKGTFVQLGCGKKWRRPRATRCVVSGNRPRKRTACAAIAVRGASPAASALHDPARAAIATSTSKHWLLPALSGELRFALTSWFWLRLQVPREPAPLRSDPPPLRGRLAREPKAPCGRYAICHDDSFSPERCRFTVRDC